MQSTTVHVNGDQRHLPHGVDPSWMYKCFFEYDPSSGLEDIFRHPKTSATYIVFDTPQHATEFVCTRHDKNQDFGYHAQVRKMHLTLVPDFPTPFIDDPSRSLKAWQKAHEDSLAACTKTLRINKMPGNRFEKNLYELLKEEDLARKIGFVLDNYDGSALIRMADIASVADAIASFDGTYWKNATIYLGAVPDDELDPYIEVAAERKINTKKTVMLFVGGLGPSIDVEFLTKRVFEHNKNIDVKAVPDKGFAFVFMTREEAGAFFARYPGGNRGRIGRNNKFIKVKLDKKCQDSEASLVAAAGLALPTLSKQMRDVNLADRCEQVPKGSGLVDLPAADGDRFATDVKVNNLHVKCNKQDIRELFKGFQVTKIIIKHGFAWVGLPNKDEARRAVRILSRKSVHNKSVRLTLVQP